MTTSITVTGGLTSDPELRYSQNGVPIASGTVASTDRYLDRDSQEWRDGKKLYLRWSAFKDLAENIAGSMLTKGSQVTITGKLHTREYNDRDGNPRSSTELEVTEFAVSLRKATVQVTRNGSREAAGAPQAPEPGQDAPWGGYGDDDASVPF